MFIREWHKNEFTITSDKAKLNQVQIHSFLTQSHWAKGISLEQVEMQIKNSICFGVFYESNQVGYARVITDGVSFGYLCDVYIEQDFRGKGLGQWLVSTIFSNEEFIKFRRWLLATRDAHTLYKKSGFSALAKPSSFMERFNPEFYIQSLT